MRLRMVFCGRDGRVYDFPGLAMAGANGSTWLPVAWRETIPFPAGSTIVALPGRRPVGWDPASGRFESVGRFGGVGAACAAAAVLPPAYLRTLLPAQRRSSGAEPLPLLGYTAVGWAREGFRVAALRLDRRRSWDPDQFGTRELPRLVAARVREFRGNRIVEQLARCSTEYNCYTAQNFFYGRREAGIPVSSRCNARCVGCISLQAPGCGPSAQERIGFEPTVEEIAAVALSHLANAREPMVSFGQGCEGEPLTRADAIAEAVRRVRAATRRGTVHINTNGSRPDAVDDLAKAGVDSLRVSLASCDPIRYDAYHRPQGYNLWDVGKFVDRAKRRGLRVALNVLAIPGVTDTEGEMRRLLAFLRRHPVDAVQLRNLNLDPGVALDLLAPSEPGIGIRRFLSRLRGELTGIRLESFNRPVR